MYDLRQCARGDVRYAQARCAWTTPARRTDDGHLHLQSVPPLVDADPASRPGHPPRSAVSSRLVVTGPAVRSPPTLGTKFSALVTAVIAPARCGAPATRGNPRPFAPKHTQRDPFLGRDEKTGRGRGRRPVYSRFNFLQCRRGGAEGAKIATSDWSSNELVVSSWIFSLFQLAGSFRRTLLSRGNFSFARVKRTQPSRSRGSL